MIIILFLLIFEQMCQTSPQYQSPFIYVPTVSRLLQPNKAPFQQNHVKGVYPFYF